MKADRQDSTAGWQVPADRAESVPLGNGPSLDTFCSAPVAERNCSHVGGWRRCAECGRETWNTANGLCIRCRPNAEAHGRRSRTVQPLVGSLDGDK